MRVLSILLIIGTCYCLNVKHMAIISSIVSSYFISPSIILAADEPRITSQVYLDITINRSKQPDKVAVGLYGDEAPESSKYFIGICKGELKGVSYDGAMVSKIIKDKEITFGKFALGSSQKQETWMDGAGKVRLRNVNLADSAVHNDDNSLTHVTGSLSIPKGGGSFEFSIIPKTNPELDKDHLVIGKVLSGIDVVSKINSVPVTREDILGSKNGFSSVGKAFDARAKLASVNKPLQRIQIKSCSVDEKASLTSFLKF